MVDDALSSPCASPMWKLDSDVVVVSVPSCRFVGSKACQPNDNEVNDG